MSWVTFHIAICTCAPAHPIPGSQEWLGRFRSNLLCIWRPISCELIICHGWGVCLAVWAVGGLGGWRFRRLAVSAVGGFGGCRFRWLAVWAVGGLGGWRFGWLAACGWWFTVCGWRLAVCADGGLRGWRFARLAVCAVGGLRA